MSLLQMTLAIEIRNTRLLSQDELLLLKNLIFQHMDDTEIDWPLIMMPSDRFSTFLVLSEGELIAYCRYFLFFEDMAELYLLIKEDSNKSIIFEKIMVEIALKLKAQKIAKICIKSQASLKVPSILPDSAFLKRQSFRLFSREHQMIRAVDGGITDNRVIAASQEDIAVILSLDRVAFTKDNHLDAGALTPYMKTKEAIILLIKENNQLRAKVHLKKEHGRVILSNLVVAKDSRRLGFAKHLIHASLAWCHALEVKTLMLNVDSNNKAAINLYLKEGFTIINTSEYYYRTLCVNDN